MRRLLAVVAVLCLACMCFIPSFAFATGGAPDVAAAVDAAKTGQALADEVKSMANSAVDFIRGIFAVVAVVFLIWAGFVFWGASGDPTRMMQAKRLLAGFLICLIIVYAAETIVGGILGILGYG